MDSKRLRQSAEDFTLRRIEMPKGEEDLARFALVRLGSDASKRQEQPLKT